MNKMRKVITISSIISMFIIIVCPVILAQNYEKSVSSETAADMYYVDGNYKRASELYEIQLPEITNRIQLLETLDRLSYCYYELNNLEKEESVLLRIINEYPNTYQANNAKERINEVRIQRGKKPLHFPQKQHDSEEISDIHAIFLLLGLAGVILFYLSVFGYLS